MMKYWVVVALWVLALSFNTIYSFLPSRHQNLSWVRLFAIIAAVAILSQGTYQIVHDYNSRIFANISKEGKVLMSNNFPWKIQKSSPVDGEVVYLISDLHVDALNVSASCTEEKCQPVVYNAFGGVAVKFNIPACTMSEFEIAVRN